jgi:hypothetical protein
MKLVVNDVDIEVDDRHAKTSLLWVLRDVLGLRGTKYGCGAGPRAHALTQRTVPNSPGLGPRRDRNHRNAVMTSHLDLVESSSSESPQKTRGPSRPVG